MGRWDQREKGDRDICLDEEEEGIGNEEERRTFAQDLLYGLCKNHQTGTADKSCIPSRLRMFTFAEANERERKESFPGTKELGIRQVSLESKKSFWKCFQEFSREISRACVRTYVVHDARGGISSTKEEIHGSPHMFYQGTLWYRRRFKGDSTMFTECRGPRRIDGGREGRAKRCIEACMPLVGLSCKPLSSNPRYFATPPYSIFRSTSIPVTSPPVTTPPCTPFPPFLRASSSSHSRPCNRFFAHLAYHVAPVSKRDFPRCTGRTTRDSLEIPVKGDLFGREESSSFLPGGIKRIFRIFDSTRQRGSGMDKVDSYE